MKNMATDWSAEIPAPIDAADEPPFVDLGPILAGNLELEKPSIAPVLTGGECLFYKGRINSIHGEPGEGKTNVEIAACNAVLEAGGRILFIDPEDTPQGFVRRAIGLGGKRESLAERCHYLHNPTPEEITASQIWAAQHKPDLVVLDGLAEALAAEGLNEDVAGDVLLFFRQRIRPFADAGAAVVIADHVAKSSEQRGRYARGSGAKLGRYDGLSLKVELGKAYTPTEAGFVRLRIAKDRNGGAGGVNAVMAEVHFTPGTDHTAVAFLRPDGGEEWRPTAIMEKIVSHLETWGEETKTAVCKAIGSKKAHVLTAIKLLVEEGKVIATPQGKCHVLRLASEGADPAAGGGPVPQFPTSSQPVPGTGQTVLQPVPAVFPPIGGTGTGDDEAKNKLPRGGESPGPVPASATAEKQDAGPEEAHPTVASVTTSFTPQDFDNDPGIAAALARFEESLNSTN
jgi:hypothetical protein